MRRADELSGFTVGVTAGTDTGGQVAWFTALGATVLLAPVTRRPPDEAGGRPPDQADGRPPDVWALPVDVGPALRLVEMVCCGSVHAVTFVAGPAVRNFMALADRSRRGRNVLSALNRGVIVACSDLECAAAAREEGIDKPHAPEDGRLETLMAMVRVELLDRRRRYRVGPHELVLQGSAVLVDGRPARLGEPERAVLAKLAERPGATVSRRVLLRHVWKDPSVGPDVLEVAVGRLRDGLGPPGDALEATGRRGYRFRAVPEPKE